jgi:hypothetical protein
MRHLIRSDFRTDVVEGNPGEHRARKAFGGAQVCDTGTVVHAQHEELTGAVEKADSL